MEVPCYEVLFFSFIYKPRRRSFPVGPSAPKQLTQRLNITFKCLVNNSGWLLADSYT